LALHWNAEARSILFFSSLTLALKGAKTSQRQRGGSSITDRLLVKAIN
jgi:hypothetical protein